MSFSLYFTKRLPMVYLLFFRWKGTHPASEAAEMSRVYTVAKIHVIHSVKLFMENPSPVRQEYSKKQS